MPKTFTQVCAFCRLVGHYWHFIKEFTHIVRPLYNVLGQEVKMGLVQLPPEAQDVVRTLKGKIQSAPVLFPDFNKPFLLETNTSKERLGAVLSQKQDDRHYHSITFGSYSLTSTEKNYCSLKLEFLTLKWSDRALQGILSVCTFRGKDGQQPFDIHPHHSQLGCHWTQVGWHTGFI